MVIDTAPALVAAIVELSLDGAVYDDLGIADGLAIARANPQYRATIIAGLAKLTGFLVRRRDHRRSEPPDLGGDGPGRAAEPADELTAGVCRAHTVTKS